MSRQFAAAGRPGPVSRSRAVLLFGVAPPLLLATSGSACSAKFLCFAIVAVGIGLAWGRGGMLDLGPGRVLRPRRLHDGHAPQDRRRRVRAGGARLHADRRDRRRCPR